MRGAFSLLARDKNSTEISMEHRREVFEISNLREASR